MGRKFYSLFVLTMPQYMKPVHIFLSTSVIINNLFNKLKALFIP